MNDATIRNLVLAQALALVESGAEEERVRYWLRTLGETDDFWKVIDLARPSVTALADSAAKIVRRSKQ